MGILTCKVVEDHIVGDARMVKDVEDTVEVDPGLVEELADAVAEAVVHWAVFCHRNNESQAAPA